MLLFFFSSSSPHCGWFLLFSSIRKAKRKKNLDQKKNALAILSGFKCLFVMLEKMDYSQEQLHTIKAKQKTNVSNINEKYITETVIEILFGWCTVQYVFEFVQQKKNSNNKSPKNRSNAHRIATASPTVAERLFEKLLFVICANQSPQFHGTVFSCCECAFLYNILLCFLLNLFVFVFLFCFPFNWHNTIVVSFRLFIDYKIDL